MVVGLHVGEVLASDRSTDSAHVHELQVLLNQRENSPQRVSWS